VHWIDYPIIVGSTPITCLCIPGEQPHLACKTFSATSVMRKQFVFTPEIERV
jgi:hypothetical protein